MVSNEASNRIVIRGRVARGVRRRRIGSVSRHVVLLAFTALSLLPIYVMIVSALKTKAEFAANQLGLPLAPAEDPIRRELAAIEVDQLSPLEALQKLYELRSQAEGA